MKILMISPYFSPAVGGVETHLIDLCKYLVSKKHTVYVRTYKALGVENRGKTEENNQFLKIHRLYWPDFNLIFNLEKYPSLKFMYLFTGMFFDCFFFLIRKSKEIDVIQAHGFVAALASVILAKIFNKRVVVNTHVGFSLKKSFMTEIIKWTLISSDKILVLTTGVKKSLTDIGIPKNKIQIYHYWVDQKIFSKQKEAKDKLNWKNKFVVLFVGRLIEVKGVMAIFNLAKELPDIQFVIIGSGPLAEELRGESNSFRNVLFLGRVENNDLPKYYSGANLLLIPSKVIKQQYEEGIPRVMIEALSCGLPVVATRAGGIPDIFSDDFGLLTNDDEREMKEAINKLFRNKEKLKELTQKSRQRALELFSIKNAEIIEDSLIYDTDSSKELK